MYLSRSLQSMGRSIRQLSISIANVKPTTSENELAEINRLMQNYNQNRAAIRTVALFEWMINIIHVQPNFHSYIHLIQACGIVNHFETCRKLHRWIDQDKRISADEYEQLQIKLIYMYAKIKQMPYAEEIFNQKKTKQSALLFGTLFKGYNMNNQPEKTIELFEKYLMQNKTVALDPVIATCVLSACSDCRRLDVGEYIHQEIGRLKLLEGQPNIRLITALMDMYCSCGSLDQARRLFNQYRSLVDHVTYSTLMKAYLSHHQPVQVLILFDQCQSSSISSDSLLYSHVLQACRQIGLPHQAQQSHRALPSEWIERNPQLQSQLIDMHAHASQLAEALRLFELRREKDPQSLTNLLHGLAIHGRGHDALTLFETMKTQMKYNTYVYRAMLYACGLTRGLVDQAKRIYADMPPPCRTADVAANMVSVLARASLFDQVETLIEQYSHNPTMLWLNYFLVCYHAGDRDRAELIQARYPNNTLVRLLYSDLSGTVPSKDVVDYFRKRTPGLCWTETLHPKEQRWIVSQFHDDLRTAVKPKDLYCGHRATQLALEHHLRSNSSIDPIHLTKTKAICSICHEQMKQWSSTHHRQIVLKDSTRIHHFHQGQCSCDDHF